MSIVQIDPRREELIPLDQIPSSVVPGSKGRPAHPSTIKRWATRGINGVKLATLRVGQRRCTSREALIRFYIESNSAGEAVTA
ncbi:MAG: DUF1580 domain-containing protein [Thermoguttaceae bacterium]